MQILEYGVLNRIITIINEEKDGIKAILDEQGKDKELFIKYHTLGLLERLIPTIFFSDRYDITKYYGTPVLQAALDLKVYQVLYGIELDLSSDNIPIAIDAINDIANRVYESNIVLENM